MKYLYPAALNIYKEMLPYLYSNRAEVLHSEQVVYSSCNYIELMTYYFNDD